MTDRERLAAILARLHAATPGPWAETKDGLSSTVRSFNDVAICSTFSGLPNFKPDTALIANAPTDLAFLAELAQLALDVIDHDGDILRAGEARGYRRGAEDVIAGLTVSVSVGQVMAVSPPAPSPPVSSG